MSKVIFDMSMSLDGYIRAAAHTPEEPLGQGGERLHQWAGGSDPAGIELLGTAIARAGAFIGGRRTYDDSIRFWGADGPTGVARLPLFIVTHQIPATVPENGVYTFVTDGIESALRQAKEAAAEKDIYVMGGWDVGRQFLRAGLLDQIGLHVVPVLFGGGLRVFDHIGDEHIQLEVASVVDTPPATHLMYNIVK
ncbi:dihydrofolate reductase family protein [Phytoactinopolyspora limicola]|uniref:dihydrofolate reductase family protein n=1 Tax=Phytoactinopolyspora limicola TaxID=2715536 RepID=UPI001409AE5A|nr:dihydrofolate reductase family protein [Phytoactinopolyspora limicola]